MKILDKPLNNIKFDKKYVFFTLIIIIIGVLAGALFIVILNNNDKTLVIEYIEDFIDTIKSNKFNNIEIFKNNIIINYSFILIMIIMGLTYILSFINILLLFYKAFALGFTLSSFIMIYNIKGILYSIVYTFPHLIINILVFGLLTAYTLKLSLKMINCIIKKKDVNIRGYLGKFLYTSIFLIILITITTAYESFLTPYLLKLITNIL